VVTTYYKNCNVEHEARYKNNRARILKGYFESGELYFLIPWFDDKRHGTTFKYCKTGQGNSYTRNQ
jgi:antitoxin component YwqK of YwqJK toxin-antitoxin module